MGEDREKMVNLQLSQANLRPPTSTGRASYQASPGRFVLLSLKAAPWAVECTMCNARACELERLNDWM